MIANSPAANRLRVAIDCGLGKKMPPPKPVEVVVSSGGKPMRAQASNWFRTGLVREARVG